MATHVQTRMAATSYLVVKEYFYTVHNRFANGVQFGNIRLLLLVQEPKGATSKNSQLKFSSAEFRHSHLTGEMISSSVKSVGQIGGLLGCHACKVEMKALLRAS